MTTSFLMLSADLRKPLIFGVTAVYVLFGVCLSNKVPAFFVFGDSLVDPGNNNYIVSIAKANYVPNGIDFGGPSGRFTNGRTIADVIGQELGLNFTPPYMAPTTAASSILQGVNYASAGSGILNLTGLMWVGRINMDAQIANFEKTRQDIISMIGVSATQDLLKKAIFMTCLGSNDFLSNYIAPIITSTAERELISPEAFVASMTSTFRQQLTRLYNLGARKFMVANVGPIGCIPSQRDLNPSAGEECVSFPDKLAQSFNVELKKLVVELNKKLKGSIYVHADAYHIAQDILQNYKAYGFENFKSSCCHMAGRFGGLVPCFPESTVCEDRSKYVFWDPFHPSEAANLVIAKRLFDGDANDVWPMNVRKLSQV
ncbi:GDSL esterase/lipase At4g16230-like [Neltuma alba]|uniref:GDSL esterase/lipase At4g16230-like n=1 Tax=Neltuma alba TaxID=207710 RepID=UPI0010A2EB4E|nr:GDSL esterase/lipase At4g16230-like [Prosopis alba]XP_028788434.1 GDSL esterase/lipase At4g16230-like [Prosopis alba]